MPRPQNGSGAGRADGAAVSPSYLTKDPPYRIGITLDMVEKLIADNVEALALFRRETTAPKHAHGKDDGHNITISRPERGTSRAYVLDRLKRIRRDLFDRVVKGELSANKAAIEAGFRSAPSPLRHSFRRLRASPLNDNAGQEWA